MKKISIAVAVFAMVMVAASAAKAGTIGNLTDTRDKISSIDMNKDPGEAGKVLDGFYSGIKAKKDMDSSVVYADNREGAAASQGKDICNAKASKIGRLSSTVPPLKSAPGKSSDSGAAPLGAGALTAGAVVIGLAGIKKGYFSHYSDDLHTVTDYVVDNSDAISHVANDVGNAAAIGVAILTTL